MSQPPYDPPYPEQPDRPYSGQPSSGQPPPYGQQRPNGQQPPYGQQPYGQQPVYGAPYGEPSSPAGSYPPPTPPKKSNALKIVLITLAVLLVLCVGGGTAFYLVGRDKIDQLADATASGSPTATPSAEVTEKTTKVSVVEPKTLNGRPKLTDKQFASIADEMQKDMSTVPDATSSVGALYGSVEKRNIVMIAAVAAPIEDPKKELDGMFAGAGFGGLKVTGISDVDPGPLGGEARCGKSAESDLTMAVCGWADDGSMGMTISFFKSVSSAKAEFPKIRGQVEKKST